MTCRQFVEFLDDYITGKLPLFMRARFAIHLLVCIACRDYLQTYRQTRELSRAAYIERADQPLPEGVPEELVRAMIAARTEDLGK